MNLLRNLFVGADPELFFVKDGHPQSVEGLIGGTKKNPLAIPGLEGINGFAIQEDNVAAEFNIPPTDNSELFAKYIAHGVGHLRKLAKIKNMDLAIVSTMRFPEEQLSTPHAKMLGCEPDFNAWTQEKNPRPRPPKELRTAAGHLHFSWREPSSDQIWAFGKLFDLCVSLPATLVTEPDERKTLYGRAGAVRPKMYGIECRTLGNFWIDVPQYCQHLFLMGHLIKDMLNTGKEPLIEAIYDFGDEIQEGVNTHNRDIAINLMDKFDIPPFPYRV